MFPDHPLFRRFENELELSPELSIEWAMRGRDFFFRPLQSDLRVLWCQPERRNVAPVVFQSPVNRRHLQQRLAKNLASRNLWRFWPWDEERELLIRNEYALIRRTDADFWLRLDWLHPFFDSGDEWLFRADVLGVERALESCGLEWDFVADLMSQRENQWHWLECARGDMSELKHGLWAYMTLSGHYLNSFERGDLRFRSLLRVPYDAPSLEWLQLRRVAELLDAHFTLRLNRFARRVYKRDGRPKKRPEIYIRPQLAPSAHERLEALLLWRDFLRGKVSDAEAETLLPR